VKRMKAGILKGDIRGAFAHRVRGLPLLFVHAGLRPAMTSLIIKSIEKSTGATIQVNSTDSHQRLVDYINNKVANVLALCPDTSPANMTNLKRCKFGDWLFMAGPERGDRGNIGGPFWTDYSVLEGVDKDILAHDEVPLKAPLTPFVQIVGHSIHRGKVKYSSLLGSICVDAGMYIGGRAFLEITPDARFISYEKGLGQGQGQGQGQSVGTGTGTGTGTGLHQWARRDISSEVCDG
jgi:hypothetical protein